MVRLHYYYSPVVIIVVGKKKLWQSLWWIKKKVLMFIADSYTDLPYNCLGIRSLITTNFIVGINM